MWNWIELVLWLDINIEYYDIKYAADETNRSICNIEFYEGDEVLCLRLGPSICTDSNKVVMGKVEKSHS